MTTNLHFQLCHNRPRSTAVYTTVTRKLVSSVLRYDVIEVLTSAFLKVLLNFMWLDFKTIEILRPKLVEISFKLKAEKQKRKINLKFLTVNILNVDIDLKI